MMMNHCYQIPNAHPVMTNKSHHTSTDANYYYDYYQQNPNVIPNEILQQLQ